MSTSGLETIIFLDIWVQGHVTYRPKFKNQNCYRPKLLWHTHTHTIPLILGQILLCEAKDMLSTFYPIHLTKLQNPIYITLISINKNCTFFIFNNFIYFLYLTTVHFLSANHKINIVGPSTLDCKCYFMHLIHINRG